MKVFVKAKYLNEYRRFPVDHDISFNDLQSILCTLFHLNKKSVPDISCPPMQTLTKKKTMGGGNALSNGNPIASVSVSESDNCNTLQIRYIDNEGDEITCSCEVEWRELVTDIILNVKHGKYPTIKFTLDYTKNSLFELPLNSSPNDISFSATTFQSNVGSKNPKKNMDDFHQKKSNAKQDYPNISRKFEQMKSYYDFVIIGSGYGGSICASRIARAGKVSVCLLERGKEKWPGSYPVTGGEALLDMQSDSEQGHIGSNTAMFDFRWNPEMSVLIGCGLGGTSLINASVCVKPDPRVYSKFPDEILNQWNLMENGFHLAEQWLDPNTAVEDYSKTEALKRESTEVLSNFYKVPIAVSFSPKTSQGGIQQNACVHCGNCVTGCNYGSKNTTLMNYLPDSFNHGCEIFCEIRVEYIEKIDTKWKLHCIKYEDNKNPIQFILTCGTCILAGGCLGSTEILLRSKEHGLSCSSMVGHKFSSNGDVLGFAFNGNTEVGGMGVCEAGKKVGPTITSVCDLRSLLKPLEEGYFIEEGAFPYALAKLSPEVLAAASAAVGKATPSDNKWEPLQRLAREIQSLTEGYYTGATNNTQTFLFMGHDDSNGTMYLKDGRLRISWKDVGKQDVFVKSNELLYNLTKKDKGIFIKDPLYTKLEHDKLITVHPLGGCAMASCSEEGVVNHKGQVFSSAQGTSVYDNLYVLDGSIIPASVGLNPLFTICAIVERAMMLMGKEKGWDMKKIFSKKSSHITKDMYPMSGQDIEDLMI